MACESCGEKPKNHSKDFTKAVVEINNPEKLVLLRKVMVPASMGDDTEFLPEIGKFYNVILQYEANGAIYLYSSDGIPTKIDASVPQEVIDRISTLEGEYISLSSALSAEEEARRLADGGLQQEIDDLKNSPDVVDIVATYADLQAYDTSKLGDNDVIRVLRDETHEGQSDYYRWSTTTQTWTFIGTVGDYYTKQQIDNLLADKQDELTAGNNISIDEESGALVISATDTTYTAGTNVQISSENVISATDTTYTAGYGLDLTGTEFSVDPTIIQDTLVAGDNITIEDESGATVISATDTTYSAGTGIDITNNVISATSLGPTVVQTTGTSTTDVMSQNAVTSMVFADPSTTKKVKIGDSAQVGANATEGVAIGKSASASTKYSVCVGSSSNSLGSDGVAVGTMAKVGSSADYSVSLGAYSNATSKGQVDISTLKSTNTFGYNNSQYRLLSGLYDPQSAHDAATKGYVDTGLLGKQDELTAGTGISISDESGALVISATGAEVETINSTDWSALWQ